MGGAGPATRQYKQGIDKLEAIVAEEERTAARRLRPRLRVPRLVAARERHLASRAGPRSAARRTRTASPASRTATWRARTAAQKQLSRQYDRTLDRATFRLALVRATRLPEAERPWLATLLGVPRGEKIDEACIDARSSTPGTRRRRSRTRRCASTCSTNGTPAKLAASKDPFVQAAQRVWPIYKAEEKKDDARTGDLLLVMPLYTEALKQALGGALAPDANATLRITYGTVKSLHPESTAQADWPFTVASQILAKDTGKDPFNSPQKLLDAIKARSFGPYADPALGGDLPIDFEADLDITGGNSGSPTIDDQGRLVGLAFDGNKEGLASDMVFDGTTTRTIHVDARYMIWTMDKLDGADHLVKEMGIEPKL